MWLVLGRFWVFARSGVAVRDRGAALSTDVWTRGIPTVISHVYAITTSLEVKLMYGCRICGVGAWRKTAISSHCRDPEIGDDEKLGKIR